jgi:hypothetical protein
MSHGPGAIERKIGELFAASHDRALDIDEMVASAFDLSQGTRPTRSMRVSTIRAAHRLIRRLTEIEARADKLRGEAWRAVDAILPETQTNYSERHDLFEATPQWQAAKRLFDECKRVGQKTRFFRKEGAGDRIYAEIETWRATQLGRGRAVRLMFHMPDVPVEVFAVKIDRGGVHWFPAELVRVTERNVMVRYGGYSARLDRKGLWRAWAFWRGVMFVSSRSGRIAKRLDEIWWRRYGPAEGGPPPAMRMPLAEAIALLGVPQDYTKADVIAAFRRKAKVHHPDVPGGSAEIFRKLVEARDRLLAALGEKAPKAPAYYPSGTIIAYRLGRSGSHRLSAAGARRLLR